MAILHGSWIIDSQESCLFIWGEVWRKTEAIDTIESGMNLHHPLAMTESELKTFLTSLQQSGKLNWLLPETAEPTQEKGKKTRRSSSRALLTAKTTTAQVIPKNSSVKKEIRAIALPTQISVSNPNLVMPQHSAAALSEPAQTEEIYLFPWQVEGFCLNPQTAFIFLQALPLNSTATDSFVGSDLRFWSHIARWNLDLLARCKFLPGLEKQSDGSAIAKWQPLLDSSIDQLRLATFSQQMPSACRTYQSKEEGSSAADFVTDLTDARASNSTTASKVRDIAVDLPVGAQELVLGFLSSVVDSQVRSSSRAALTAISSNIGSTLEIKTVSPTREWLQSLQQESGIVQAESSALENMIAKLSAWTAPLQNALSQQHQFRTCFQLIPPSFGTAEWSLNYCLQAADENEFLVDARTIWNNSVESLNYAGRTIQLPQETLLSGLGLASKLYPLIEPTLQAQRPQSCPLKPLDAYNFIKSVAWRFTDSGLGVVLPPSLTHTDGWASRLGLSIKAETTPPNPPLARGGAGEINPPLVRGARGG